MTDKKRIALRIGKIAALVIAVPVILFALTAWIGSAIPRNSDWQEARANSSTADYVEIFIASNGIHTEIAMPIAMAGVDWRDTFSVQDITQPKRNYTHVAVSWGEKGFFLETPTWADLNLAIAANALTGGDAILHVAWYVRPAPDGEFRPLKISRAEYAQLVGSIKAHLPPVETRQTYAGYSHNDVFYDAVGTYHIANTCNQWTSDQLYAAGIKTGLWTPLPGGVMKWVPPLRTD